MRGPDVWAWSLRLEYAVMELRRRWAQRKLPRCRVCGERMTRTGRLLHCPACDQFQDGPQ